MCDRYVKECFFIAVPPDPSSRNIQRCIVRGVNSFLKLVF